MVQILCKQRAGLRVCHINAQSLKNKLDEFSYIFESSEVDVVCISETWFSNDLNDSFLRVKGFNLYRADRFGYAGGSAIYIKQGYKCKVIARSDATSNIEYVFVEAMNNDQKILIGSVYRPSRQINCDAFFNILTNITLPYSDIIVAGDLIQTCF